MALEQGVEISSYWMIGDNPAGDIAGANRMGWESVLVQTGVFNSGMDLEGEQRPKHLVRDMKEAVDLILSSKIE